MVLGLRRREVVSCVAEHHRNTDSAVVGAFVGPVADLDVVLVGGPALEVVQLARVVTLRRRLGMRSILGVFFTSSGGVQSVHLQPLSFIL